MTRGLSIDDESNRSSIFLYPFLFIIRFQANICMKIQSYEQLELQSRS